MKRANYAMHKDLPGVNFDHAVEKVTAELKEEGFGVLTTIDVRKTLREKIGAEFRPYTILGACNPVLAHRALSAEDNIGLLLACNVVVAETAKGSEIGIIDPATMLSMVESPAVEPVAVEARARLARVLEKV